MACSTTKLRRRLRKEIADKKVVIINLQSRVDELGDQLQKRTETCDKQQEHIKGLEINFTDYQKYFNELGSKGNSKKEAMKSMPESMSNPENLRLVTDIQLREQIQTLQLEFDSLRFKINDNNRTIENLNDAKSSLQHQLNVSKNEIAQLNTQLETANARLKAAESMRSELASQHQEVLCQKDAMLTEAETEMCRLSGEVEGLKSKLSSAEEIHLKLQTQNAELLSAMDKAESDLELQHQEVLCQKDAMLAEAEKEIRRLSGEAKDLKTSLSSAEEIYLKLQTQNAELLSAMGKAESDLELQHQEVLSQKDAMLTEAETERCRLSDEVNDLKSSLSSAEEIHLKLQTQNAELLSAMDKAESDLKLQHQEVLSQKDAMLAEAEKEIRRLSGEVEGLKSKLSSAEEIYLKLQTENAELVSAIGREMEELRETVSELADCRKDRDLLLQTVANLTDRIANPTTERQQVDSTLADLAASNKRMLSERDSLQEELSTLEKARLEFEDRLKALECSHNNLEAQLNQSEAEKEKLSINLQEKNDGAEITESALKDWSQRYASEVAKYESAVKRNDLVCESYGLQALQVTSLTNGMSELILSKEKLSQANDDLRTELSEIRMQLETMRSKAEQHCNENKQFIESIEGLTQSKNANEAEVQQLQQKLQELNNVYVQLVERCSVLDGENQSLKKSAEDLEIKRDALISQLVVSKRKVVETVHNLNQTLCNGRKLSMEIDELKFKSAESFDDKTKIEAELQLNVNLVNHLSEELEENKTNLAEKSQLVDTLRDQIDKLKASDILMMTKNSELSEDYEAMAKRLYSTESSRDSLSRECTSLTEQLKRVEGRIKEMEIERRLQANAKDSEIKSLEVEVASLKEEMASTSEVADRKQSELLQKHQTHQEEVATISSKADARIAEMTLFIEKLTAQNERLSIANAELSSQLNSAKTSLCTSSAVTTR